MTTRRRRKKNKELDQLDELENEPGLSLKTEIKPRTTNQVNYVKSMIENEIIFCSGPAGAGKSMLAINTACVCLVKGLVEKIVITKPLVNCGSGLGWLGGSLSDKVGPYVESMVDLFNEVLGKQQTAKLIKEHKIEIIPLELCRGKNFHKTFVICDESQNATRSQLVMILTRHGQDSKTVVVGDAKQTDLYYNDFSGIVKELDNPPVEGLGIVKLERSDIQRSGIIARILERLED